MENNDKISQLYYRELDGLFSAATVDEQRRRIHWVCRNVTGKAILDIGCSQGIISILLAREGYNVTGLDIDQDAIDYAMADKQRQPPEVQDRLEFIRGDFYDVELPTDQFDTVIMGEFLEHQTQPEKAIDRAVRLLTNNGKLIITVPFGIALGHKDHKQVFYTATLCNMLYPLCDISDIVSIEREIGVVGIRRTPLASSDGHVVDLLLLGLLAKADYAFRLRDLEAMRYQAEATGLRKDVDTLTGQLRKSHNTIRSIQTSISYRLTRMALSPLALMAQNRLFEK